jgi:hypothetical protein
VWKVFVSIFNDSEVFLFFPLSCSLEWSPVIVRAFVPVVVDSADIQQHDTNSSDMAGAGIAEPGDIHGPGRLLWAELL